MRQSGWSTESGVGSWLVSALGVFFGVGTVWHLTDLREVDLFAPLVVAMVLDLALSVVIVYAGYWLARSDIGPSGELRVFAWCVAGLTTMVVIQGSTVIIRLAEGHVVEDVGFMLLVSADAGALAGLVAGVLFVRLERKATATRRAQDAVSFLNRLLGHDVLNTLAIVRSHADILADHVDDEGERWLETIRVRSENATDLIRNSRTVTRTVLGEGDVEPVELADVLGSEVETARTTFAEAKFDDDIPPDVYVTANGALASVFDNLLANAVEHNDAETPTVVLDVETEPNTVTVRIADDGPGISAEQKSNLFEPADGGDHGFGLFLADTLVSAYGGTLSLTDNEPRGTVFEVKLPRADAS